VVKTSGQTPAFERGLMSARVLRILILACSVLLVLWLIFVYRQIPRTKSPYANVFATADSVQLEQGPHQIFLQKKGSAWTVGISSGATIYAVEDERWHSLSAGLQDVQLEDVISKRKESADAFEVGAEGIRATVRDASGKILADGVFGKQASDAIHIYFRYPDQSAVYLARGLFHGELGGSDLSGWRDHTLISMSEDQIDSVQIQSKGNNLLVQKSSDTWTVNHAPGDPAKIKTWLGSVAHVRADDFVVMASTGAPQGSDLKQATLTLKSATSEVTLHMGTLDPKTNRVPVSTAAENGIAWISGPRLQALFVKPADLLKKN
jgi:hypothetical protein